MNNKSFSLNYCWRSFSKRGGQYKQYVIDVLIPECLIRIVLLCIASVTTRGEAETYLKTGTRINNELVQEQSGDSGAAASAESSAASSVRKRAFSDTAAAPGASNGAKTAKKIRALKKSKSRGAAGSDDGEADDDSEIAAGRGDGDDEEADDDSDDSDFEGVMSRITPKKAPVPTVTTVRSPIYSCFNRTDLHLHRKPATLFMLVYLS